jgi:hypothetical protein
MFDPRSFGEENATQWNLRARAGRKRPRPNPARRRRRTAFYEATLGLKKQQKQKDAAASQQEVTEETVVETKEQRDRRGRRHPRDEAHGEAKTTGAGM